VTFSDIPFSFNSPLNSFLTICFSALTFQVRNAQRAGAAGVIIADNICLCSDVECIQKTKMATCETQEPILADDGSGSDISIPSYLMFKHDADLVKEELLVNRAVQIEMAWNLPNPDNRVEYDLWTTPSDMVSKGFLRSFKFIAQALEKHAYFTPHMYIYDGARSQCHGNSGQNYCGNLCTNNGRYCATDMDKDISGADVVRESLRRSCIWSNYGASDGIGKEWWDYVSIFDDLCTTNPEYFTDQACINEAYKASNVSGKLIERCMEDSGGTDKDITNSKLESELTVQTQRGVVVIPTAFVNTAAIRGALNVNNVFTAICSSYLDGTAPVACMTCGGCQDPISCLANGYCSSCGTGSSKSGGISTSFFLVSVIMVVGFFSVLGAWHYKRVLDDMREHFWDILAGYIPVEDNDMMLDGRIGKSPPKDFAHSNGITSSLIS
jgi:PA domain